jgi:predicted ribosomally synthesized peptide with SipW-like signal peptide
VATKDTSTPVEVHRFRRWQGSDAAAEFLSTASDSPDIHADEVGTTGRNTMNGKLGLFASITAVGAVAVAIGGGTYAGLSDTESVQGESVTAGVIDLQLRNDDANRRWRRPS